jgi:hypothetical protein
MGYPVTDLDSMTFDYQRDTLWVMSSKMSCCEKSTPGNPISVMSRNLKGEWSTYKLDLFAARPSDDSSWGPLTSIAAGPDGTIWLSMLYRHFLVYFDGVNWKTLNGENLPNETPATATVGTCKSMIDPQISKVLVTSKGKILVANLSGVLVNNVDFWK